MKKLLCFMLMASFVFVAPSFAYSQINAYRSSLSSYIKIDSTNTILLAEPEGKLTLVLSRDATFTENKKTNKKSALETMILKVEIVETGAEKEEDEKEKELANKEEKPLFNKKSDFSFSDGAVQTGFNRLFAVLSIKNSSAHFDVRNQIFPHFLQDKKELSLHIKVRDDQILTVVIPESVLEEWRRVMAVDMLKLTDELPIGVSEK